MPPPPTTALALRVEGVDDLTRLAKVFAASGMFGRTGSPDTQLAQCAVQLMAGMEAGITPFASITGIHLINGKPGFSSQLLAQAIKRHPRYDYRVLEKTSTTCRIRFIEAGEQLGIEEFTMAMAERAGLLKNPTWRAYPEAMLFARCLTAGMRTHCPDALGGIGAYTPEELGAQSTDEQGMPVQVATVCEVKPPMLTTTDDLVAGAQRACDVAGLTPAGMVDMLEEFGNGEASTLAELPPNILARLAKSGISAETAARFNEAGELLTVASDDDPDDLPATWAEID